MKKYVIRLKYGFLEFYAKDIEFDIFASRKVRFKLKCGKKIILDLYLSNVWIPCYDGKNVCKKLKNCKIISYKLFQ